MTLASLLYVACSAVHEAASGLVRGAVQGVLDLNSSSVRVNDMPLWPEDLASFEEDLAQLNGDVAEFLRKLVEGEDDVGF